MNIKNILLSLLLCLLLIGLAGIRVTTNASDIDAATSTAADEPIELVFTFEVRVRLPILEKDVI